MKKIFITSILAIILSSCTKTIYVPVESLRTEYIDRMKSDSVYLHDSILVRMKGDTVWMEKYRYMYKDRVVKDSILIQDTIRIPYPVIEVRETNRLNSFQSFQIWCGRIVLFLLLILIGWKVISRKI